MVYRESNCKIMSNYTILQNFIEFNTQKKRDPYQGASYLIIYNIYLINLYGKYRGYRLYPAHRPGNCRSGWQGWPAPVP